MVYTVFEASAPGSLMIMGEHAVLHDKLSLCAAVDQRVSIRLQARCDNNITLTSNAFSPHQTTLDNISIQKPYQFILGALIAHQPFMSQGCDIVIDADFSHTMGLGSSAAVTVAGVAVLRQWLNLPCDLPIIMQTARKIVRQVQGGGSGADVAASTFGAVVAYRQQDEMPVLLDILPVFTSVYCGYKTLTMDVIRKVTTAFAAAPEKLQQLFNQIDACVLQTLACWQQSDWQQVGLLMQQHFKFQQQLGVSDTALDHIIDKLQQQPGCYGAKISGSGLGDCVIALGEIERGLFPDITLPAAQQFLVKPSILGVAWKGKKHG